TWTPVPGCTSLPLNATQCVWASPGPATNTGRILIEAVDRSGARVYFSASGQFRIVSGLGTPLGLQDADFGAVGVPGSSTFDGTVFTVRGSGADVWCSVDQFHYTYAFLAN